jgi:hypothetical protein
MQPSLTIFANFNIDSKERLKRMKDSFYSFKNINPDQWIVNIRGSEKFHAGNFLKQELGEKINLFYIHSRFGWFYDSRKIASYINSDFVFIWIEDHILIADPSYLRSCIDEMKKFGADQLWYSWFIKRLRNEIQVLPPHKEGKYITVTKIDNNCSSKIHSTLKIHHFYITTLLSIMTKDFFIKNLYTFKPYLKRYPRKFPFDFEKISTEKICPIIYHALPNKELFASIDDNIGHPGYSLISRGLYKSSVSREELKKIESQDYKQQTIKLNSFTKYLLLLIEIVLSYLKRAIYTVNIFFNK